MAMQSCFFTGHRSFSFDADSAIVEKFRDTLADLAADGVTDFYAGGAVGWDSFCAMSVILLRSYYRNVKLHLILPCPPELQTAKWNERDKAEYNTILKFADDIEIVSDNYDKNCMKKRNARLASLGDICVCYYNEKDFRSGTGQTVRMAQKANKLIINMYDYSPKQQNPLFK